MTTVNLIDVPGQLQDRVGVLGVALAHWATRDDSKPQPEARRPPIRPWTRSTPCSRTCTAPGRR